MMLETARLNRVKLKLISARHVPKGDKVKKIKGLNDRMASLLPPVQGEKVPTFKEGLLNILGVYRPDAKSIPAERLKVTKLGMMILSSTDDIQLEGDYFELLEKIVEDSKAYPEFIMGQWMDKLEKAEEIKLPAEKK